MARQLTALIIMDGFGLSDIRDSNAVEIAETPNFDRLWKSFPHVPIHSSGLDVGLPEGQMGNSEVGHLNIGAGRIVYQEFTRITKAIRDGDFFENKAFLDAVAHVKKYSSRLHLMGLVSEGGVHSHIEHLYALVELAKKQGLSQVYIHAFMDGRDVPPASGKSTLETLDSKLRQLEFGKVATVSGRYYAMDRDRRWDRVQKAYNALVLGEGEIADSSAEAMDQSYNRNETDEFVKPTVILEKGKPVATISENDAIIFFNFRPDRARELTRSFIEPSFGEFERKKGYFPVKFVSMTQYDATFENLTVAYEPQSLTNTFGQYISEKGKTQLLRRVSAPMVKLPGSWKSIASQRAAQFCV
jgi:2,3-bisphosphoglycerate-independent phosphoglycerate mutase